MQFYTVRNWNEFQHYGKRNPPWIKLHRALLDDYNFCSLDDSAKAHLILLWIFASQHGGEIPNDTDFLEKKLSCKGINVMKYVELGFLVAKSSASD